MNENDEWLHSPTLVMGTGNPWVFFTLSLLVSVCTHTHESWVRVLTGFTMGMGMGMGMGFLQINIMFVFKILRTRTTFYIVVRVLFMLHDIAM